MVDKVLFSSDMGEWNTPPDLVADMAEVFKWALDACASGPNVCENYYNAEQNSLLKPWRGMVWMNPPYGRGIGKWMQKAVSETETRYPDTTVVCLVPARTDTIWWHTAMPHSTVVVFIEGRLTFGSHEYWQQRWYTPTINGKPNSLFGKIGKKNSAPFPSALIVFGKLETQAQKARLYSYGWPAWGLK